MRKLFDLQQNVYKNRDGRRYIYVIYIIQYQMGLENNFVLEKVLVPLKLHFPLHHDSQKMINMQMHIH